MGIDLGAVFETREHKLNRLGELHYAPVDAVDPTGADDNFAYFRNDGNDPLEVLGMNFSTTVAGVIKVERCTGTPSGGTAVSLIKGNGVTNRGLEATFQAGADITGLTDAGIVGVLGLDAAHKSGELNLEGAVILNKDEAVLFNWSAATGVLTGAIKVARVVEEKA